MLFWYVDKMGLFAKELIIRVLRLSVQVSPNIGRVTSYFDKSYITCHNLVLNNH